MRKNITKEMHALEQGLQAHFTNLYCKEDFDRVLRRLQVAARDERPSLVRRLADMLHAFGISPTSDATLSDYRHQIDALCKSGQIEADRHALLDRLLTEICGLCGHFPTPVDYMTRIVEQLDPSDTDTPLRLRIFKRLASTINVRAEKYNYYAPSLKKRDLSSINDSIFEERYVKKPDFSRLLSASEQLASGNLISPVSTKELLFLFAFAYEMRYWQDTDAPDYEPHRDVRRNLFADYYSDNLARYLDMVSLPNGCSDTEPTGAFLSPKSFVDAAFLYSLNLTTQPDGTPYTPALRLSFFYKTLSAVSALWCEQHPAYSAEAARVAAEHTVRDPMAQFLAVLAQAPDALVPYLADNYYCERRYPYTSKNGAEMLGTKGFFDLEFSSNTAYARYDTMRQALSKELTGTPDFDFTRIPRGRPTGEDSYSHDLSAIVDLALQAHLPMLTRERLSQLRLSDAQIDTFLRILSHVCDRLQPREAFSVYTPAKLTRTKQLAAFFHLYCFGANNRDGEWTAFADVLQNFSATASICLEEVGFSPISSKSLYDMLLIFIAYYRINELNE